ncbi:hypothetical protein Cni_G21662 [Canna indica]|uniref:Protein kinase domain-containing protein n=1 Tax=Canna indica TaxID=4628 RepID=A0AAQ3KQD1_9LILI|nr:hypothetical protein Cni_G21662 [Canna indica]
MERYGLFFLLGFSLFSFASSQLSRPQKQAMESLKQNLNTSVTGAKWNTSDPNPCSWSRVTCLSSSAVTKLDLADLGLSTATNSSWVADFFNNLCLLDSLQYLNLSANFFTSIPDSFFNCSGLSGLKHLNISSNRLAGPLQNFSNFGSLETLDLSFNELSGGIDSQLDGLAGLRSLNLSDNSFVGAIPYLQKARGLEELVLSENLFVRSIPSKIGLYQNLTFLDLSENNITGTIPHEIGNLPKLKKLVLSSNSLSGQIPDGLGTIKTLYRFAANQNNFNGTIPSGITRYVKVLDLSFNKLSGPIPSDLLSYPTLESVDLTNNSLQGPIPVNLSQSLNRLRLGWNTLNGTIPQTIGELNNLNYLELDGNNLNEQIPRQISGCKNLTLLNLASNHLNGDLPKELGSLQRLVELKLQLNNLTGTIPDELFKLTKLSLLNLSHNSLTGAISSEISNLSSLTNLNLQYNNFYGHIPTTISSLKYLIELRLGNNQLSGTIPNMPSKLAIALDLSSNLFNGPIPSHLSGLTELEVLDLSNNHFSGEIPYSFTTMRSLTLLNLSNNQLSGIIPPFKDYVTVITYGNKFDNQPEKKRRHPNLFIVLPIVGAVIGLSLVAVVLMLMSSRRIYRVKDERSQLGEITVQAVVDGHFITANTVHKSSIDFSKTMEVVADPRNIVLKTRFSTYYKAVMPNGFSYSVKKLNWADKIFQMESHERFGKEMEVLGKLCNSNIMVPLAYVLTEDSAYLFYEHIHKGTVFNFLHKESGNSLDWPSRYNIMLGVAQGLTFLHGCNEPVLLLDLSTKSIQLKSLKEPQIGDIELSKVIDPSKSTGSLSTIAGSVGYIPPEYAYMMKVTMAGNVYSFGVVLLELLTGKPPVSSGLELAKWALSYSARPNEREQILDSRISKTSLAVRSQMLSVLRVALACVSASPEARPKMRNTLRMLFNAK